VLTETERIGRTVPPRRRRDCREEERDDRDRVTRTADGFPPGLADKRPDSENDHGDGRCRLALRLGGSPMHIMEGAGMASEKGEEVVMVPVPVRARGRGQAAARATVPAL